MLGLKVPKKQGEETRQSLLRRGILATGYKIKHEGEYLVFPITEEAEGEIVETTFEKLPEKESIEGTFDVIGDIAIVEDNNTSILKRKNINAVYKKSTKVKGTHRTREYTHLAGEKKTETVHKEYGCRYVLDITTVYFNPRLATERHRVTEMVRDGETILDMFAGVGPFSILIAKRRDVEVHSVDINPDAIHYLKKNIELNKVENVTPYLGDCREVVTDLPQFDRIIMNLPMQAHEFMDTALTKIKEDGIIHLYSIKPRDALEFPIVRTQQVKSYAPGKYVWRHDIRP